MCTSVSGVFTELAKFGRDDGETGHYGCSFPPAPMGAAVSTADNPGSSSL